MELDEERARQLDELLVASATEVMRAKVLILEAVAEGPCSLEDLRTKVLAAQGLARHPERDEKLQMPWPDDPSWRPDRDHAAIARVRLLDAAEEALAQLASAGALAELGELSNSYVNIPIQRGGNGFGHRMTRPGPRLAQSYGRPRREHLDDLELLDVDIFAADLVPLGLDARTLRCLQESLASYRRGLFLSAVSLIGAVSEGAWYAAGEQLRSRSSALGTALDGDRTAKVIELTANELGSTAGVSAGAVRELQVHAAYLRDLRNYGVHPRPLTTDGQEHAFTDHGAGLILMQTHRYLVRLSEVLSASLVDSRSS